MQNTMAVVRGREMTNGENKWEGREKKAPKNLLLVGAELIFLGEGGTCTWADRRKNGWKGK